HSSSDADRCAIAEKLAEAHVAAKEPLKALALLADPRLQQFDWAKFWRAQALASLHRWADALPLYQEPAAKPTSPFRAAATFGAAEALRALERPDEAVAKLTALVRDKEWAARAQLRLAELYIAKADATDARRVLDDIQPRSLAERKERRLLRGQLELALRRPEKAISAFQAVLHKPEDIAHEPLVAALLGIADGHLQLKTPESGDDVIEQFVAHHPADAGLLDRINLLAAQAQYLAKRFAAATAAFEQIGHSASPWAKIALFDACTGWLQLGDHARFVAEYNELEKQGGDEESRASLRLEEGLLQAAKGDKKAAETLQKFIRDFPRNPRVSEAWVG